MTLDTDSALANPLSLTGKVAIITGGASGIGLATARAFVAADIRGLTIVDRTESAVKEVTAELGDRILPFVGDVTDEDTVKKYTQATVDKFGQLDIVFLNAGIEGVWHPVHETPMEIYDKVMDVNCRAVFCGLKYAIEAFLKSPSGGKGCSAIITSSIAGLEGVPGISPYTCSKFAVRGLACIAAQEYGHYGIRVNSVMPGFIKTPFALKHGDLLAAMEQKAPMKRLGEPEDIANGVLYLASDASKFCTGSSLKIDGGITNFV